MNPQIWRCSHGRNAQKNVSQIKPNPGTCQALKISSREHSQTQHKHVSYWHTQKNTKQWNTFILAHVETFPSHMLWFSLGQKRRKNQQFESKSKTIYSAKTLVRKQKTSGVNAQLMNYALINQGIHLAFWPLASTPASSEHSQNSQIHDTCVPYWQRKKTQKIML